jgi:hypothetical protein
VYSEVCVWEIEGLFVLCFVLCVSEFVWKFTMSSTINDSNESMNLLSRGSIFNFLNNFL